MSKQTFFAIVACAAALTACADTATAGNETGDNEVLAKVGETEITRQQVTEKAASALAGLRQQEYEIMRGALDQMVEEMLLDAAAAKEGLSRDEFLQQKVEAAVSQPTPAEVEDFFATNRSRLGGRSLDDVREQIAQYLYGQQRADQYQRLIRDLRKSTEVAVMLDPPRIDVSVDDDPSLGPEEAPVTIVAFTDYQCPYCSRAEDTIKQLRSNYGDKLRVVIRDFPLDFHQDAQKAAEAAGCAMEQGKFEAMHDKLFENQRALGADRLVSYADAIGLDMEDFRECLDSGSRTAEVRADLSDGQAVGVSGTPAFFVNGRMLSGALPYDDFAALIDEELGQATN
jgi:protein-disulfide isomerase